MTLCWQRQRPGQLQRPWPCALAALREVGVVPAAVVVNESPGGVSIEDTLASLEPHTEGILLTAVSRGDAASIAVLTRLLDPEN